MNRQRTIHKQYTLRILSLMLGLMAFSMAAVLCVNAFRNGKTTSWQLLVVNVFAQSMFDVIASTINEYGG